MNSKRGWFLDAERMQITIDWLIG